MRAQTMLKLLLTLTKLRHRDLEFLEALKKQVHINHVPS